MRFVCLYFVRFSTHWSLSKLMFHSYLIPTVIGTLTLWEVKFKGINANNVYDFCVKNVN